MIAGHRGFSSPPGSTLNVDYSNPPVHEVVVDLQFSDEVEAAALQEIQHLVQEEQKLPLVEPLFTQQVVFGEGQSGEFHQASQRQFSGWLFRGDSEDWVLKVMKQGFSLHAVRPGPWPSGPYVGWSAIADRFERVHSTLKGTYEEAQLKRIGLRYLNRLALPKADDLANWLTVGFHAPTFLEKPYAFSARQTWEVAGPGPGLSATLNLAKIQIEDQKIAEGNQGILLDIEIFNLWVKDAPEYENALDWLAGAHEMENRVFESCVTDQTRNLFGEADELRPGSQTG